MQDPSIEEAFPRCKHKHKLPVVLSLQETNQVLNSLENVKHRLILMTAYSAGLRVSELVRLKPKDIDSKRKVIYVNQGKGNKDRYTILSKRLLPALREYWKQYQPGEWLFPGQKNNIHMTEKNVHLIYHSAKKKAGITKDGGIHTLRHCFATHLLEQNVNLRTIQVLMGHKNISSTSIYLRVSNLHITSVDSPYDQQTFDMEGASCV